MDSYQEVTLSRIGFTNDSSVARALADWIDEVARLPAKVSDLPLTIIEAGQQ